MDLNSAFYTDYITCMKKFRTILISNDKCVRKNNRPKYLQYIRSSKLLVSFMERTHVETLVEIRKNLHHFIVGVSVKR